MGSVPENNVLFVLTEITLNSLRPGPFLDIFGTLQITKYFAHNNVKMKDTKQGF